MGQSLAVYPLVYVIAGPLMAVLAGGRPQRAVSRAGLVMFAAGNLVSANATSIAGLIAGRVVAAIGASVFTPNAGARAASLGAERRGRAMSIVASGFSLATIIGAPLGVYFSSLFGWRSVLVTVAGCAIVVAVPQGFGRLGNARVTAMGMRQRLRFLGNRKLLAILLLSFAVVAGEFVVYSYIALIVGQKTGAGSDAIALAIMIFGVGTAAGTLAGGFGVDRFGWRRMLRVSVTVIGLTLTLLPFVQGMAPLLACLLTWAVFGWTFTPSQTNRLFDVFPDNGALLITLVASAVQIGIAAGGFLGGIVVTHWSIDGLAFTGALLVWASLAFLVLTDRRQAG